MKKETISIKRKFSIENINCPQIIIELSDGGFWSCAKVNDAEGWTAMPCEFCNVEKSIRFKNDNFGKWSELSDRTFEGLETKIWEMINDVKIEGVA